MTNIIDKNQLQAITNGYAIGQSLVADSLGVLKPIIPIAAGTNITLLQNPVTGQQTISASTGSVGVTSLTGTADQITASASTGAVTLSLPINVVNPTLTATAETILGSGDGTGTVGVGKIRGAAATGDSIAGNDLYIDASNGTGSGGSGKIILRTAAPISSSPVVGTSTAGNSASTAALTFSHTVPVGSNRILIIQLALSYSGVSASSVTYGGVSATLLSGVTGASSRIETWYLIAPAVGTSNVIVNLSSTAAICARAINITGANQSTPFGAVSTVNSFGTSASISPVSTTNQLVIDLMTSSSGALTITGGQTAIWTGTAGTIYAAGSSKAASSPTTTISYSFANSNYDGMAFAVNFVANSSPDTLTNRVSVNNDGSVTIPSLSNAGVVKADVSGILLAAVAGTDYYVPSTGIGSWTSVALTIGGPINNVSVTLYFKKIGDIVFVEIPSITVVGNNTSASIVSTTAIPATWRPTGTNKYAFTMAPTWLGLGVVEINTVGFLKIFYLESSAFPAVTGTGLLFLGRKVSFSYSTS
jgi:hypothetical protein